MGVGTTELHVRYTGLIITCMVLQACGPAQIGSWPQQTCLSLCLQHDEPACCAAMSRGTCEPRNLSTPSAAGCLSPPLLLVCTGRTDAPAHLHRVQGGPNLWAGLPSEHLAWTSQGCSVLLCRKGSCGPVQTCINILHQSTGWLTLPLCVSRPMSHSGLALLWFGQSECVCLVPPMSHPVTACAYCRMSSMTTLRTSSAATSRPALSLTSSSPAPMGSRVRQTHLPLFSWCSSIRCWWPRKPLLLPLGSSRGKQARLGEAAGVRAGTVLALGTAALCAVAGPLCHRVASGPASWMPAMMGVMRIALLFHVHTCMASAGWSCHWSRIATATWVVLAVACSLRRGLSSCTSRPDRACGPAIAGLSCSGACA